VLKETIIVLMIPSTRREIELLYASAVRDLESVRVQLKEYMIYAACEGLTDFKMVRDNYERLVGEPCP